MFQELSSDDQRRIQDGLHIGRVINEYQGTFQRGDFLVRNVMGADDSGAIQITDVVRVGQTVQFHVRDAETADEDLRSLLVARKPSGRPVGALLFTCNGRGTRLFDKADHDVGVIHEVYRPDTRRRLLRHGRDRPDRRPELRPRLHGQHRALRAAGVKTKTAKLWNGTGTGRVYMLRNATFLGFSKTAFECHCRTEIIVANVVISYH